MSKRYSEKNIQITPELYAVVWSENTRYGFRHLAELHRSWQVVATAKSCYYNRTWESYQFETVLKGLLSKAKDELNPEELKAFEEVIKNGSDNSADFLKTIGAIASLGAIFGSTQTEQNDWKARMLKAGLENKGLIMPDDWNELDEDEKERRLNGVIEIMGGNK